MRLVELPVFGILAREDAQFQQRPYYYARNVI
jgi:hypothetical protein